MTNFKYVYILRSERDPERHYTGITDNLKDRLKRHNTGQVSHTAKHVPWKLRTAIAFPDEQKAIAFEKYLKSHSGRVFASRHF